MSGQEDIPTTAASEAAPAVEEQAAAAPAESASPVKRAAEDEPAGEADSKK